MLYRYRYPIRLEGKSSIGIDIEFEKKEQLANIRFRTQTNVYRTTLIAPHVFILLAKYYWEIFADLYPL